jgi:hypothetical protein
MPPTIVAPVRPVLPVTRAIFLAAAFLAALAGIQLYILTARTDHFFAWTIANPLSAAFIGAGYWTGAVLLLLSVRERAWANVRIAMAAVAPFVPLMLLTTLLHLDKFHFQSSAPNARIAAWAWMIVYLVVPFAVIAVYAVQLRLPGRSSFATIPGIVAASGRFPISCWVPSISSPCCGMRGKSSGVALGRGSISSSCWGSSAADSTARSWRGCRSRPAPHGA